jgi:alpha-glucosidase
VVNVQALDADPTSILTLYRQLLSLRRRHAALSIGTYEPVAMTGDLLAYVRRAAGERFLVALNLGSEPHSMSLRSLGTRGRVVLSTPLDRTDDAFAHEIALRADEGVVVALTA